MQIRDATESDFGQITEIYNDIVLHSTATWNDRPATVEERIAWWQGRVRQGYPVLVAADQDRIAGFATFGDFRSWPGYRFTVEVTIYIHAGHRGQGIGARLLAELTARAQALGKHSMIAAVDSENSGSLRFLERHGFQRVGYIPEAGFKFGRFLDLVLLQCRINASAAQ
jgi:L-amino acid N-acyltransferase YncA